MDLYQRVWSKLRVGFGVLLDLGPLVGPPNRFKFKKNISYASLFGKEWNFQLPSQEIRLEF